MTATLHHRGPDSGDVYVDDACGLALGHRRLAIIDLSPEGHQPMRTADGRFVIVFNGEIYNYEDLRADLVREGVRFRGHSDTEVLLEASARWGVERTLRRANGMFAFALWDSSARVLWLTRDRFGEKPLYYSFAREGLLFGSELKALCAHPQFRPEIDPDVVALYLRHNYVPGPHAIYRGVRKLPPGTLLRVTADAVRDLRAPEPHAYWSAADEISSAQRIPFDGSPTDAADRLDALLRNVVKLRMISDVPLGAFLSGGIDSSTVVALMQAQSSTPVRTFTIGFHEAQYNEAAHARAVADHLRTDHTELYVTANEAEAVVPLLPRLYDEPFADSSQIPTYLVSKLARTQVTVALSGDAGDEFFGGYNRYFWGETLWRRLAPLPANARAIVGTILARVPPRFWDAAFAALGRWLPSGLQQSNPGHKIAKLAHIAGAPTSDALYQKLVSYWQDTDSVVLGARPPQTWLTQPQSWPDLPDFFDRMAFLDTVTYLPDNILVKVDRAAMGVSLETRVPLLDPEIFRFAWSLPKRFKVGATQGKLVLRDVLFRYVPRELVERPKMGFGIPVGQWIRTSLRDWAESLLSPSSLSQPGWLDVGAIRRKWDEHLHGRRNWQDDLWGILMFQAWRVEQLEQRSVATAA